jgi:hypothetical protein
MWMRMRMAKTGLMETMMVSIKHGDVLVMCGIYVAQSNETTRVNLDFLISPKKYL